MYQHIYNYYTENYVGKLKKNTFLLFPLQTLSVSDEESFNRIPDVPGLVSYRSDNKKLYVSQGTKWQALCSEQEVSMYCMYDYIEIRCRTGPKIPKELT